MVKHIKVVEAVEQHPDSLKPGLLDDERLHGLQGIVEDLKDDEDKSRYEDILNNKPQCRDQIRAYLAAGTTHRMERSVAGYEAYLNQRDSALDLKLHLSEILWGGRQAATPMRSVLLWTLTSTFRGDSRMSLMAGRPGRGTAPDSEEAGRHSEAECDDYPQGLVAPHSGRFQCGLCSVRGIRAGPGCEDNRPVGIR